MSGFEFSQDLDTVALEPVHFSGLIQPFGILLAVNESDLSVLQVSANVQECCNVSAQALLGRSLEDFLDVTTIERIRQTLSNSLPDSKSSCSLRTWIDDRAFDGTVYRTKSALILELELAPVETNPFQIHSHTRSAIAQLRQVSDLTEFLQAAALEVREMTKFDRVMIYQFDSGGAGAVVAEATREDLSPYLGLHYPATDIPEPVRELYRQRLMRYIPDLSARSIELIPAEHEIDLRFSILRSVDSCCVEYHQNMDVAAILVIALVQGDQLWGLISCHHEAPKLITYEMRQSCELLSQLIASELANKVNTQAIYELKKLRSLSSEFINSISKEADLKQALTNPIERLLNLVNAQGAAVYLDNEITLLGKTPSLQQVQNLLQWADTIPLEKDLFHTNSLSKIYIEAETFKETASGLLLLQLSKIRRYTILWFRPEVLQTVNWAGDPNTSFNIEADGSVTLCPRKSFEKCDRGNCAKKSGRISPNQSRARDQHSRARLFCLCRFSRFERTPARHS
jgi:two-component system, chemotaxis family, sensor kinase Cph1